MPTLGDLRNRIIVETNRSDLGDDLASILDTQIQSAINYYANERFWFNEARTVTTFTAGQEYQPLPTGQRIIDGFWIVIGGVRYWLTKRSMDYLENLYTVPQIGQPTDWAAFGTSARVWPTPNIAYSAIWLTVSDVTPALDYSVAGADNSSENIWTDDGYDLITARTKVNLYRDQFRDTEGAELAALAMNESYSNLKGESNRRMGTGRIRSRW